MSQEKVDRYKAEKANRRETIKKEKIKHTIRKCVVAAAAFAIVAWLGFSAYNIYEEKQPRQVAEVDYSSVSGYLEQLNGTAD